MSSDLHHLPRVTPDDLETFKAEHFPCRGESYAPLEEYVDYYDDVDDDQLGYYLDGVKRTLTDDQIAMFRNSEIYALIRQRQVRKENEEAEFGVTETAPLASGATESKEVTTTTLTTHQHALEDSIVNEGDNSEEDEEEEGKEEEGEEEEEEYLRFLEREKRKAEAANNNKNNNNNERNNKRRKKTKPDAHTHRRIARELDIVAVDEQMLDYDEGCSTKPPMEASKTAADSQRHEDGLLAEGCHHATAHHQARDRRSEGRKIWWPCIREG